MSKKDFSILSFVLSLFYFLNSGEALNVKQICQDGNQRVFLLDNLLRANEVEWLNGYFIRHRPWVLNQQDVFKESHVDMNSNATWVSPVSTDLFERTRLWKEMSTILRQFTGREQYLCYAMFTLTYRLDFKPASKTDDGLMVQIFLNKDMTKNDYGETVFYDDRENIMCGIHPQPGRIIMWNSTINYMPKPTSMLYVQSQHSIVLKLTSSSKEYQGCKEFSEAKKQAILDSQPKNFPFTDDNSNKLDCLKHGTINYAQHLTNKYYDSQGREIAVFDDVLSQSDLHTLREYLVNDYHTFGFQPYDSERSEDHDNVAWISVQESEILVQSGIWQVIKQAAIFLSGLDQWYPYDVSMNIIHSYHHTRIHEDCELNEHEYTFLLYLNPEWNENLYGETVFFEQVDTEMEVNPGDEEYEIIAAVRPRYGRIVIFRGIIPHSARPPSPDFRGARYTFACKVSKTYGEAKSKKLRETIDALQDFGLEDEEIKFSKEFDRYEGKRPDDIVNSELSRQKQKLKNLVQQRQEYIEKKLSETPNK